MAVATRRFLAFTVAILAAQKGYAFSFPLPTKGAAAVAKLPPLVFDASGVDFTNTVSMSGCSGSLVRLVDSKPEDKAMVLTNGHCYEGGFIQPGKVVTDKASTRSFTLLNANGSGSLGHLQAERVIYAAMTRTDLTLYRLNTTYAAIEAAYGVKGLTIANTHPEAGMPIRIPSGYWRRIYSCSVSGFVYELREGAWTFRDAIRYQQPGCEVIGGTSGSPIIHAETHEVIGVNNTTNESGQRCTENNPCEVDEDGHISVTMGASYGQQLYWIYGCLNENNQFDLSVEGCQLLGARTAALYAVP